MRPSQIKSQAKLVLAIAAALAMFGAGAAQWEPVAAVHGDRIELDKSRIVRRAEGSSTAWSRLALERDFIDEQGLRYTAIEALNRYDCEKRSLTTLKRIYRRDGQTVREEAVANSAVRELVAEPGSADDKLLTEVCKPRSPAEARTAAVPAPRPLAARPPAKPAAMYADMRSAGNTERAKPLPVSEPGAAAKSAEKKPVEAAAEAKATERPRFIDLPKLDKSHLEGATAAVVKPPAGAGASGGASASAGKSAERPARNELERIYATSGPRKAAPKKAAPEDAAAAHRHIHWSYEGEGAPANWGKLRADYATCGNGKRQSPIDIRDGIKVDLEGIAFDYKPTQFRITDTGHSIQVDVGEGSTMRIMEREFQLLQFHFHRPSEERINGKPFDMVVHFVHKDWDGKLAVVAVLLERGVEHALIQTLWNYMPLERGDSVSPAAVIDLTQLLPPPERRAYYTYMGSLTTPPCSEEVLWMVFRQPLQVSPQQIAIFSRLYSNNARPVQPVNGRLVKETR